MSQVSISECEDSSSSDLTKVSVGANQKGDICWKVEPPSWVPPISIDNQKYTDLLQKIWNNNTVNLESLATDNWKTSCPESKWSFSGTAGKNDVLGLCTGESNPANQQWIRLERKDSSGPEIEVCKGVCFQSDKELTDQSQNRILDPSTKTWNWYPILFKVKNS